MTRPDSSMRPTDDLCANTAYRGPLYGPDFWGTERRCEKDGPDLRDVTPFTVELQRLLRKTEAIQADPFTHLPAGLNPTPWPTVIRKTTANFHKHGAWK